MNNRTDEAEFTVTEILLILETPLGKSYSIEDPRLLAERKKITKRYDELGCELGFEKASLTARAEWLMEYIFREYGITLK